MNEHFVIDVRSRVFQALPDSKGLWVQFNNDRSAIARILNFNETPTPERISSSGVGAGNWYKTAEFVFSKSPGKHYTIWGRARTGTTGGQVKASSLAPNEGIFQFPTDEQLAVGDLITLIDGKARRVDSQGRLTGGEKASPAPTQPQPKDDGDNCGCPLCTLRRALERSLVQQASIPHNNN